MYIGRQISANSLNARILVIVFYSKGSIELLLRLVTRSFSVLDTTVPSNGARGRLLARVSRRRFRLVRGRFELSTHANADVATDVRSRRFISLVSPVVIFPLEW